MVIVVVFCFKTPDRQKEIDRQRERRTDTDRQTGESCKAVCTN